MSEITYLIFIFPGYFIFLILRSLLRGFGEKADALDKIIQSMFFNIPVFILTVLIYNKFIINNEIRSIDEAVQLVYMDISILLYLIVIVLLSSSIVGIIACPIILISEAISNKLRGYKIYNYRSVYRECIVKPKYLIPMEIYDIKTNELIDKGFMKEASTDEEDTHEFILIEHELFKNAIDKNIIKEVKYTYNNIDKGYKIIIYDQRHLEKIYNSHKKGAKWWKIKIEKIKRMCRTKLSLKKEKLLKMKHY